MNSKCPLLPELPAPSTRPSFSYSSPGAFDLSQVPLFSPSDEANSQAGRAANNAQEEPPLLPKIPMSSCAPDDFGQMGFSQVRISHEHLHVLVENGCIVRKFKYKEPIRDFPWV